MPNIDFTHNEFEKRISRYRKLLLNIESGEITYPPSEELDFLIDYCLDTQNYNDALNLVYLFIMADNENFTAWQKKGMIHQARLEFKDAVDSFDKALIINPEDSESMMQKAACLSHLGHARKAIKLINEVIADDESNLEALFIKGTIFQTHKFYKKAVRTYKLLLKDEVYRRDALQEMAFCFQGLMRFDLSIKCFDKLIDMNPYDYLHWYNKGLQHNQINEISSAIESIEMSIAIYEDFFLGWYNLGIIKAKTGRIDSAINSLNRALIIKPGDLDTLYNIACLYKEKGHYNKAIIYFSEALSFGKRHFPSYFGRGSCYDTLEQYDKALNDYDSAVRINPDEPELWYAKADIFYNKNDLKEALKYYKLCLDLEPTNIDCMHDYGMAQLESGKIEDAKTTFKGLIKIAPDMADGHLALAKILKKQNDEKESLKHLNKAISLEPERKDEFSEEYNS